MGPSHKSGKSASRWWCLFLVDFPSNLDTEWCEPKSSPQSTSNDFGGGQQGCGTEYLWHNITKDGMLWPLFRLPPINHDPEARCTTTKRCRQWRKRIGIEYHCRLCTDLIPMLWIFHEVGNTIWFRSAYDHPTFTRRWTPLPTKQSEPYRVSLKMKLCSGFASKWNKGRNLLRIISSLQPWTQFLDSIQVATSFRFFS